MRDGLAALEATATALVRPHFLALLAEALSKVDRIDEASALLDEATTIAADCEVAEGEVVAAQDRDESGACVF